MSASPRYSKVFRWSKLISITGGAQAIVQGAGLICGILVIRLLPVNEYAWYTIANTMLGTISLLADGGISTGVMTEGGKIWQNRDKLGVVLITGLYLRKKFAFWSLIVSTPILVYLLMHNGANWLSILLITASLIPAFFAALSDSLLEIVPKLHQDIISLQKNQLTVGIGRLILTGILLFIFPFTFIALLASGIPRAYGNINLKNITNAFARKDQNPDLTVQKNILKIVKRILPSSIYFCISSQITIWLISIFGSTESIAQVGALGRLGMIFNILTVVFVTIVVPRFARLPNSKILLRNRFLQIQIAILALCGLLVLLVSIFPNQILWIIGEKYKNLSPVLVIAMSSSIGSFLLGSLYSISTSRGWIIHPILSISVGIFSQIILILLLNFSTVRGVYYFSLIQTLIGIFLSYLFVFYVFQSKRFFTKSNVRNQNDQKINISY